MKKKALARNVGEFVGHILRALRTSPTREGARTTVKKTVEEEDRGNVVLRRTTIDEVEIKAPSDADRG